MLGATTLRSLLREPIFDRLDADIAHALMSINAVKGVEIGAGFASVAQRGTEHRDEMSPDGFLGNHSGGIAGGIAGGPATFAGISTGAEMLQSSFANRNEAEIHAEALREVSADMESEVVPHTLELENKSVSLTGTVAEQYAKLREVLTTPV